jgi:hypothetical protein
MKTGKKIVIVGAIGVVGFLIYLYLKNNKKKDVNGNETSSGGGISGLIESILPSSETDNTNQSSATTTAGGSVINQDPLSTSEQKIADAILKANEDKALAELEASRKEAEEYILKIAQQKKAEEEAKMYAATIYDSEQKIARLSPNDSLNKTQLTMKINMAKNNLKRLGYVYTGAGTTRTI